MIGVEVDTKTNKQTNKQTLNYLVNAWTFYMFVLLLVVSFYVVDMFGT